MESELDKVFRSMEKDVISMVSRSYEVQKADITQPKIEVVLDKNSEALFAKLRTMNTATVKSSMANTFKAVGEPVSEARLNTMVKDNMSKNIDKWATQSADSVVKTMSGRVNTLMQTAYDTKMPQDQLVKGIQDIFTGTTREGVTQATAIARTESSKALNSGKMAAYKEAGVTKKEWISSGGANGRESHARFDKMGPQDIDFKYDNEIAFPGDPTAPVDHLVNCRCSLVASKEA